MFFVLFYDILMIEVHKNLAIWYSSGTGPCIVPTLLKSTCNHQKKGQSQHPLTVWTFSTGSMGSPGIFFSNFGVSEQLNFDNGQKWSLETRPSGF